MRALVHLGCRNMSGLCGTAADEVIHQFIQAMIAGLTYKAVMPPVPVHPTVSELILILLTRLRPLGGPAE